MSTELTTLEEKSLSFLSEVEKAEGIRAKFKIINKVLNQPPIVSKNLKQVMLKKGLNAGKAQDFDYVPVEVVEESLRQIFFRQVDFLIKHSFRDLNSFVLICTIRYKDPISQEIREIDGIGAKSLQQNKGAKIDEFNSTMKANALELGVGIAYSRAIKNAAKKLGRLFGADLNRDEELDNVVVYSSKVLN